MDYDQDETWGTVLEGGIVNLKKRLIATLMAGVFSVSSVTAYAGWMEDFYNSAGAAANNTPGSAIKTQSMVGYSGGGISWRVPNKMFQPFQITPPSFGAGCNGIDAYLGSFSFVNKEAFVQALRNMGQAAIGQFFMVALRSLSPDIATTLTEINDIAQRINALGLNTCQAGKAIGNSVASALFENSQIDASNSSRASGESTDNFDATQNINQGGPKKTLTTLMKEIFGGGTGPTSGADLGSHPAVPIKMNLVYYLLQHSNQDLSADEMRVMMSLFGASPIINTTTSGGDDDKGQVMSNDKGPLFSFSELVGDPHDDTSSIQIYKCLEEANCIELSAQQESIASFSKMAFDVITTLQTGVNSGVDPLPNLSPLQKTVLKLSSIPLVRYVTLSTTSPAQQVALDNLKGELAQFAGLDAATNLVRTYRRYLDRALATNSDLPKDLIAGAERARDNARAIQKAMEDEINHIYAVRGRPFEKLDELDKIERKMYADMNRDLANAAHFGLTR